jgi:hypothetical protein
VTRHQYDDDALEDLDNALRESGDLARRVIRSPFMAFIGEGISVRAGVRVSASAVTLYI